MSQARALRRKVKRAIVNNNISAEKTDKIIDAYIDQPRRRQEMYNEALGEMVPLFAGYQRIYEKRGKKKITEAVENFVTFCNDMSRDRVKRNEIMEMLKDETGYHFMEHAGELELNVEI